MFTKLFSKIKDFFSTPVPTDVVQIEQVAPVVEAPKVEEKKPEPAPATIPVGTAWPFPVYYTGEVKAETKAVKPSSPEKAPAPEKKKPGRKKKEQPVKTSAVAMTPAKKNKNK